MPSTRRRTLALAMATGVALAGCSGGGGDGDGEDDSPLAEYMGADAVTFEPGGGMSMSFGGSVEYEGPSEEEIQLQRDFEESVAACMADLGFEYVANVVTDFDYDSPWQEAQALPENEFAEEYGYGISTLRFDDADAPPDPNQEYRESMSPEAMQAYERALQGVWADDWDGGDGEEWTEPPIEDQGCYGQASAEVYGNFEESFQDPYEEFEALFDDLHSLWERFDSDPRLDEPVELWRDCMADAGYSEFTELYEPEQSVHERLGELEGWDEMEAEIEAQAEGDEAPAEDGSDSAVAFEPREVDPADLEELQEYERELATADYACLEEHYNDVWREVQREVEAEFVKEHRAELERYRDWLAENESSGGLGAG